MDLLVIINGFIGQLMGLLLSESLRAIASRTVLSD